MRRLTRLGAALALGLGLAVGLAAAPASAHGGKIDIELGTDGAGGISAALVWAGDKHPVEESAVVEVRAVSDTGDEVGPITLVSASEGVGWYRSEPAVLDEGHWTVTARVKEPARAKVETEVDVVAPPAAAESEDAEPEAAETGAGSDGSPPAENTTGPDGAGTAARADDVSSASSGLPGWAGWVLGAVVVAGAAAVVLRRRRTP
ncbi:hypothetical protein [Promicromonospora sp. NPDC019610]|uniref:hypothetical protein n=1 Tax=Promicromonospora sp. NPDC019610 TaxID=3364405 RepID=UPI00378C9ACB